MPSRAVYLDHLSATPVDKRVFEAMKPFFMETFGNPSSLHRHGLRVKDALNRAREQFALLINAASSDEIIFTSGGTEANNLAVKGAAYANQRRGNHIVVSAIEHPSVLESVAFLEKTGFRVTRVRVDSQGIVDPEEVRRAITDHTILIAVQHANHDIGAIQPVAENGRIAARKGIVFFCDATASGGWVPLDVQTMNVGLLSLAPHRFYGPKGVGVLYQHRNARLAPIIHGGSQENGRRAGVENLPAIVGGGMAAELARRVMPQRNAHAKKLQKRLLKKLLAKVRYAQLNGPPPGPLRSPCNISLAVKFVEGESLLLMLDHHGVCVAGGAGCVARSLRMPYVLNAIGLDPSLARGTILMTLGRDNSEKEMDEVAETIKKAVEKLRGMSPIWEEFQRDKAGSRTLREVSG
ncbi:MAG: aminotransferase class V-fold PLP-dependent enzyme [Verrucomicrobia bacterium]|nr:aminotransferase class V-fold PLP-dependent enzyme [Verrucomicrobiota bacterium]